MVVVRHEKEQALEKNLKLDRTFQDSSFSLAFSIFATAVYCTAGMIGWAYNLVSRNKIYSNEIDEEFYGNVARKNNGFDF